MYATHTYILNEGDDIAVKPRPLAKGAELTIRTAGTFDGRATICLTDKQALEMAQKLAAYLQDHAKVTVLVRTEAVRAPAEAPRGGDAA